MLSDTKYLHRMISPTQLSRTGPKSPLVRAALLKDWTLVNTLLDNKSTDSTDGDDRYPNNPFYGKNATLHIATQEGQVDVVHRLLSRDIRVPGCIYPDYIFVIALTSGHLKMVDYMISIGIDPAINGNIAIGKVCDAPHTVGIEAIVERLLQHPNVDPSARNNKAIRKATSNNLTEVVKLLLRDARVDPSVKDNACLSDAVMHDNVEIISLLLADPRVDPTLYDNKVYHQAARFSMFRSMYLLRSDERVRNCEKTLRDNRQLSMERFGGDMMIGCVHSSLIFLTAGTGAVGSYIEAPRYPSFSSVVVCKNNFDDDTVNNDYIVTVKKPVFPKQKRTINRQPNYKKMNKQTRNRPERPIKCYNYGK